MPRPNTIEDSYNGNPARMEVWHSRYARQVYLTASWVEDDSEQILYVLSRGRALKLVALILKHVFFTWIHRP